MIRSLAPRCLKTTSVVSPLLFTTTLASLTSKSMAPRLAFFSCKIKASSCIKKNKSLTWSYCNCNAWSPSNILLTFVYVILSVELIIPGTISWSTTSPRGLISIKHEIVKRSTLGFKEQIPFESLWGNIGITRSAKYIDVPRAKASLSSAVPSST